MPLYEYECEACHHAFEELVFPGDEVSCPSCASKRLTRNLSLPAAPQTATASLPMGGCGDPNRAPCGSACRRLQSSS